tara:strand:+ start:73 stop:588 length:516 start_codon:yes stop_codon:yes gene_type:complete
MTKPYIKNIEQKFKERLKILRDDESNLYRKWGNRKRIFNMVGVDLEIKFCRAEMIFKESMLKESTQKKLERVEMMIRGYETLNSQCEYSGYHQIQPQCRSFLFNEKIALVCDTDDEKPLLVELHKDEKDTIIFSIEELLRCIPKDFMEAKRILSKLSKEVSFRKVSYEQGK